MRKKLSDLVLTLEDIAVELLEKKRMRLHSACFSYVQNTHTVLETKRYIHVLSNQPYGWASGEHFTCFFLYFPLLSKLYSLLPLSISFVPSKLLLVNEHRK